MESHPLHRWWLPSPWGEGKYQSRIITRPRRTRTNTASIYRITSQLAGIRSPGAGSTRLGTGNSTRTRAPVTLTGAGGNISNLDALPDMFVANINVPGACTGVRTERIRSTLIPGRLSKTLAGSTTTDLATPTCTAGGGRLSNTQPTVATSSAAGIVTPPPAAGSGVGGLKGDSSSRVATATQASAPIVSHEAGSPVASNPGSACPTPDEYSCKGSSYLVCADGIWVAMPLAPGTRCIPGPGLTIVATNERRKARFEA